MYLTHCPKLVHFASRRMTAENWSLRHHLLAVPSFQYSSVNSYCQTPSGGEKRSPNEENQEAMARKRAEMLLNKQRNASRSSLFTRRNAIIAGVLTVLGVSGVVLYARYEGVLAEQKRQRLRKMRAYGQAQIGGGWELLNEDGKPQRSVDFIGNYVLMYFGFVNCPDICPDEMEKIVKVVDDLTSDREPFPIVPVFISVDPKRDTPDRVKQYCKRFSPKMRGFTSDSEDKIKALTKKYRAYYSRAPAPEGSPPDDYLVDHSIIIYLLGPSGEFIEHFGRDKTARQIAESIRELTGRTKNWWNLWGLVNK